MPHLIKKAFLLIDSLLTVFIVTCMCFLCFSIYNAISVYREGYNTYQDDINSKYEDIFNGYYECEACVLDESD